MKGGLFALATVGSAQDLTFTNPDYVYAEGGSNWSAWNYIGTNEEGDQEVMQYTACDGSW